MNNPVRFVDPTGLFSILVDSDAGPEADSWGFNFVAQLPTRRNEPEWINDRIEGNFGAYAYHYRWTTPSLGAGGRFDFLVIGVDNTWFNENNQTSFGFNFRASYLSAEAQASMRSELSDSSLFGISIGAYLVRIEGDIRLPIFFTDNAINIGGALNVGCGISMAAGGGGEFKITPGVGGGGSVRVVRR